MKILNKLSALFKRQSSLSEANPSQIELMERLARLERSYIVLLKRMLEMDGVQLMTTKASAFNAKVLQTPGDEITNKGLNEPEPTIH